MSYPTYIPIIEEQRTTLNSEHTCSFRHTAIVSGGNQTIMTHKPNINRLNTNLHKDKSSKKLTKPKNREIPS